MLTDYFKSPSRIQELRDGQMAACLKRLRKSCTKRAMQR